VLGAVGDALSSQGWTVRAGDCVADEGEPGPALAIVDVDGPDLDLERVLADCRDRVGSALPVLLIGSTASLSELARVTGASTYLGKPFGLAELLSAVRAIVARA
jgi:DNA-binding response OmpR family regulator